VSKTVVTAADVDSMSMRCWTLLRTQRPALWREMIDDGSIVAQCRRWAVDALLMDKRMEGDGTATDAFYAPLACAVAVGEFVHSDPSP
jgi:hypothetical protein